jgi:hypothetical protein
MAIFTEYSEMSFGLSLRNVCHDDILNVLLPMGIGSVNVGPGKGALLPCPFSRSLTMK